MSVVLTGLDGCRPLDFLAALGVLAASPRDWKMSWTRDGAWRPVLHGPDDMAEVIQAVLADHAAWETAPALGLQYDGKRDLKPTPVVFRRFLSEWMGQAWDRGAAIATSYGSELVTAGDGKSLKPTALLFTSGQQKFLDAVLDIRTYVNEERVLALLTSGGCSELGPKALNWDGVTRDYALRAFDPSKSKPIIPAAEWLGFRGMTLIPTGARGATLYTACTLGSWKYGRFRWALWSGASSVREVAALITSAKVAKLSASQREARGIVAVWTSRIGRSDQGGYGSFSPSRLASTKDDP